MTVQAVSTIGAGSIPLGSPTSFSSLLVGSVCNVLKQGRLELGDVLQCSLASREIHKITCSEEFWQFLLRLHFEKGPLPQVHSKQVYLDEYRYHYNVKKGVYASKTLNTGESKVSLLRTIRGDQLLSTHDNGEIKIWDLNTEKQPNVLKGHSWCVLDIAHAPDGTLVSVSGDGQIKYWSKSEGLSPQSAEWKCTDTFSWEKEAFRAIIFIENKMFFGPRNGTIQSCVWGSGEPLPPLLGHQGQVSCLAYTMGKLISGAADGTIRIWDLQKGKCSKVLGQATATINVLEVDPKRPSILCSGSDDGQIKVWDLETEECIWDSMRKLEYPYISGDGEVKFLELDRKPQSSIQGLICKMGKIFLKRLDGMVEVWNWYSEKPCYTIKTDYAQNERSYGLSFINGKLYTGSSTSGIQVIDFRASNDEILKEIAELFKKSKDNWKEVLEVEERLKRMPGAIKHQIEIVERKAVFGPYPWNKLNSSQKAQVIESYLNREKH